MGELEARPEIVSAAQWQVAKDELMAAEKAVMRARDEVSARRRRLPMVEFGASYTFQTPSGPQSLLDLFEGRRQLFQYQFMDNGPDHFCPGCTWFTDNIPAKATAVLADQDITWITISDMPLAQMTGYWDQQGWTVPHASSHGTAFTQDTGCGGGFMFSVFLRDGDTVYRTYSTFSRGVEPVLFLNNVLDFSAFGRQEDWEDSPEGWPQHPTYG